MKRRAWTPYDDAVLIAGVRASASNKRLARELERSVDAVIARLSVLRRENTLPPAALGRRALPLASAAAIQAARDAWMAGLLVFARRLPAGMRVVLARAPGESASSIFITHQDGDESRHAVAAIN